MRVYAADAVDATLIEAGRVDGVGELRIFFTVAFRLLLPGSVTVLLFSLVATWNNYFLPLIMLNSADKFPLTVGLAQWQSTASAGSGRRALFSTVITGSLLSIIPLVIAFVFLSALLAVRAGFRWRQGLIVLERTLQSWTHLVSGCCSAPPITTSTSPHPGWRPTST